MRESGEITITDPGADKPIAVAGTLQCCHCGTHWIPQPGSGRIRGWCSRCNGPVCGPGCAECVPHERQIENIEAGRDVLTPLPASIVVPGIDGLKER